MVASASAVALLGVGLLGSAASAEPGNIDPGVTDASLTIHKFDGEPGEAGDGTEITDPSGLGNGLEGVEFTIYRINVDLTTSEGWQTLESYYPNSVPEDAREVHSTVTTGSGGSVTTVLPVGAYYVEETGSGSHLITTPVVPFIVTIPYPDGNDGWNYKVHVYPKNVIGETETSKTADDLEGEEQTGDEVTWTITATVPKLQFKYHSFVIEDSVGTGLTFKEWGAISVGDIELVADTDYTVDSAKIEFTQAGLDALNAALTDAESVTVTAELTTTVTQAGVLENTATITANGTQLPEPTGTTNWGDIVIEKFSAGTENKLQGAEFELYDGKEGTLIGTFIDNEDGTYSIRVWIGNDADVTRDGLWIKETKAPAGHVASADPWTQVSTVDANSATPVTVEIDNHKPTGPDLPLTGAQGTVLLTLIGVGLIGAGAVAVGIRRARANN